MSEFERGLIITPGTDRQLGTYGLFRPASSQRQALELPSHTLEAKSAAPDLLWVSFAELCGVPLESADYSALAGRYPVWVIDGVPAPLLKSEAGSGAGSADAWERFLEVLDLLREKDATLFLIGRGSPDREIPGSGPVDAEAGGAATLARIADRLAVLRRIESDEQLEDESTGGC
ncbi:MAG: AFG1/ZapE family ATPase [Actinomycetes bacterium]